MCRCETKAQEALPLVLQRASPAGRGRLGTVRREHGGARSPELQPLGPAPGSDLAGVRPARRRHPGGEE